MPQPAQPLPANPAIATVLAEIAALYQGGKYMDAWRHSSLMPPFEAWPGAEGLLLAGQLAVQLGNDSFGRHLHVRAHKLEPDHPDAIFYRACAVWFRHGPLESLRFLKTALPAANKAATNQQRAHLLLLEARILAAYRDFSAAEALAENARLLTPDDPWVWVELSALRECQDQYGQSLADASRACELAPRYRPSVEAKARALCLLGRRDEAIALLTDALEELQSATLARQLATQYFERGEFEKALVELDRADAFSPLADRACKQWLAARRCDAMSRLGRRADAAAQARQAGEGYYTVIAERLEKPPAETPRRVQLPVGFVRQHYMTCAPATLSAIAAFWKKPVDHAALAQAICYDGTPDHVERHWAQTNGWIAREFRVTWETAVALIDRGCPFTLTTVFTHNAHLQAVIGYDSAPGTLLIRDPYHDTHGECLASFFLDAQAPHGPRGMVLVPAEQASLLDGIELPEAALYDRWFLLRRAIATHDRAAAQEQSDALLAEAPQHRLTQHARREIACYDGNDSLFLSATRALLALYPASANYQIDEVQTLQRMGRHADTRALLRERASARGADPALWRDYAEDIGTDARLQGRALKLLRRVLRRLQTEPGSLRALANLFWRQRNFDDATQLYRLAACAGDKIEHHWSAFFAAGRHVRQGGACLALLRRRVERFGTQSSMPARTLFTCCEALDQTPEAFRSLENALQMRPDDGGLMLFAADAHGRYGRAEQASAFLEKARRHSSRTDWLHTAASIAGYQTRHADALAHWEEFVTLKPNDQAAHNAIARLLAMLKRRRAALDHLAAVCEAQPGNIPLRINRLEWLRGESPGAALALADELLSLDPANEWTLREKALTLRKANRIEEAIATAQEALRVAPHSEYSAGTLGTVLMSAGRHDEARAAFEQCLRLSLRASEMIGPLMESCADAEARRRALVFLQEEISKQADIGEACLRFQEVARGLLEPAALEAALREAWAQRPEDWSAWAALARHLREHGKLAEARAIAAEATGRFPLLPALWIDLALVHADERRDDEAVACLRQALSLNPSWGLTSRHLAQIHERALRLEDARLVMEKAVSADPLDVFNHAKLAEQLWRLGQKDAAIERARHAIRLDPSFDWPWHLLHTWCSESDPEAAYKTARELAGQYPGNASAWIRAARFATGKSGGLAAALEALSQAEASAPRSIETHDLRAELLAQERRFDEALEACNPPVFAGHPPRELLGRAAWIERMRGNMALAIERLTVITNAHPDYLWARLQLTECLWQNNQAKETAESAARWSLLDPSSSLAQGYIAAGQLELKNRPAAKTALLRMVHNDPSNVFGAQRLLQLHVEDDEHADALAMLNHIRAHLDPAQAQLAEVRWSLFQKDKDLAARALAGLAQCGPNDTDTLREAAGALADAGPGWSKLAVSVFKTQLDNPKANPAIGTLLAKIWTPGERLKNFARMRRGSMSCAPKLSACIECIDKLGEERKGWRLSWLRFLHSKWLRADTRLWGAMGYALVSAGECDNAIPWLSDWRERHDAQPWMLYNLAYSLFLRARKREAMEVIERALTLPPDHTRGSLLSWQALELALDGKTDQAASSLSQSYGYNYAPYALVLHKLAEVLVAFLIAHSKGLTSAAEDAYGKLEKLASQFSELNSDITLKEHYKHALALVSRMSATAIPAKLAPLVSDQRHKVALIIGLIVLIIWLMSRTGK